MTDASIPDHPDDPCGRYAHGTDMTLSEVGLDPDEVAVLTIARNYFQAFAVPESHAWMHALVIAAERLIARGGPEMGYAILSAVQAMRRSRRSVFHFSNPHCPICREVVTQDERLLMGTLVAIRLGFGAEVRTQAVILCEAGDPVRFIAACAQVAGLLPPRGRPHDASAAIRTTGWGKQATRH